MGGLAPWIAVEPLERLLREIVPTWVDGAVARKILPSRDRVGQFVIALNAREPSTDQQYIARGICCAIVGYTHQTAASPSARPGSVSSSSSTRTRSVR